MTPRISWLNRAEEFGSDAYAVKWKLRFSLVKILLRSKKLSGFKLWHLAITLRYFFCNPLKDLLLNPSNTITTKLYLLRKNTFVDVLINGCSGQAGQLRDFSNSDQFHGFAPAVFVHISCVVSIFLMIFTQSVNLNQSPFSNFILKN